MYKGKYSNNKSPGKSSATKRKSKKSLRTKQDTVCGPLKVPVIFPEPMEDYQPSAGLFEEEEDVVEGKDLFHVTPLKHRKSFKDAELSAKLTPLSQKIVSTAQVTPNEEKEKHRRSIRHKMKQELANLQSLSLQSDPEDSDEYSSNEEESDDDAQTPRRKKEGATKSFSETYFHAQKQKKSVTSNRTLSNLKLQHTDMEHLQEVMKKASVHHIKDMEVMAKRYKALFQKWNFLMHEGFNVLLYGVGSKRHLLNTFCKEILENEFYISFKGFFPALNIKHMLSTITEEGLCHEGKFSSLHDHCEFIKSYFAEGSEVMYIVIHNIDGMSLRNVKTQAVLSSLAALPNIRFICTIDHINSPLIWDQIMLSRFRWVWFDVTTFEPYVLETSYDNTILREQSSQLLLSSLLHVYRSLTPNGQGVFRILAQHQLQDSNSTGITFHEWYQECREGFLVNSEITMQAQLSEFKNHKLLTSKKSFEGTELWYIPVDRATLEQFSESCK